MINLKSKFKKIIAWSLKNKNLDSEEILHTYIEKAKEQKLVNLWFIVSSSLPSLSFAFLIGLLSVKPNEISSSPSLIFAITLISASLFLNAFLTMIFFGIKSHPSENDEEILYSVMSTNIMRLMHTSSFLILPTGVIFLIFYFSMTVFLILTPLTIGFLYIWNEIEESVTHKEIFRSKNNKVDSYK
ncbi:hypothetical protein N0392_19990 [Morganella morganii]|uniref:Uncharacterized protein n=1 Tax=Morganella morganii TaxID=582 RepID=A0A9Q4CR53_MORMO|nr:hypothetical protein [Morganella morganii]MCY0791945.1 hypothetical protein [Morganella morganii]